ncbi:EamA family transporter [Hufsiella ginkgonis]|uniref:EamA family transporter n=1 Tax=Hufsiella ginkgonis TaxID=2695274 RepID=A0A7K1Y070_9SPHI|nr:EamA family transporter [Hufsiella ginkgonis]MXV16592.1 EamA family transporter [Hufsiella ginkgonis]
MTPAAKPVSSVAVIVAFATVYIVWGSTYFFIRIAVHEIPPFLLGAIRFMASGLMMLAWCLVRKEDVFNRKTVLHASVSGFLMLFIGNGIVIWVEQHLPSALVAILVSAAPLWFVLLDKPKWRENFSSRNTIFGLLIGFAGVILLFYEKITAAIHGDAVQAGAGALALLMLGSATWAGGSLYSKYHQGDSSTTVTSAWQMLAAGIAFMPGSVIGKELGSFNAAAVPADAWLATAYLVVFGSIAGFSAYVWLLKVRSATQVSTYGYVNPVVAVILGVVFAGESITVIQVLGLAIILGSVLLINLSKYRGTKKAAKTQLSNG